VYTQRKYSHIKWSFASLWAIAITKMKSPEGTCIHKLPKCMKEVLKCLERSGTAYFTTQHHSQPNFICHCIIFTLLQIWHCIFSSVSLLNVTVLCCVQTDSTMLLMIFYLIAKFGISASYLIVYPFAGGKFSEHFYIKSTFTLTKSRLDVHRIFYSISPHLTMIAMTVIKVKVPWEYARHAIVI